MKENNNVSSYYDDIKYELIRTIAGNRPKDTSGSDWRGQYIFHNTSESECVPINLRPDAGSFGKEDLKVAWAAWCMMSQDDRAEVITFFRHFYRYELFGKTLQEQTYLFCSLSLEHFVPLLSL